MRPTLRKLYTTTTIRWTCKFPQVDDEYKLRRPNNNIVLSHMIWRVFEGDMSADALFFPRLCPSAGRDVFAQIPELRIRVV